MAAAVAGDVQAREQVLAAHLPLVYNVVGRALDGHADVDDVVQDTMLRALNALDDLRDPGAFRSWLIAIAMNQIRRHCSPGARPPVGALDQAREVPDPGADFVELTIWRLGLSGQRREVAEATRWLDADNRELLSLWWLEAAGEITRGELADALGIAPAHAAVRVQRVKEQLEAGRLVVRSLAAVPGCPGLQALTASWDEAPSALWRKRIARHVRDCAGCSGRSGDLVPAEGLLARLSLVPLPLSLSAPESPGMQVTASATPRQRPRTAAVVAVAAVLAAATAVALWPWGPGEGPTAPAPAAVPPQKAAPVRPAPKAPPTARASASAKPTRSPTAVPSPTPPKAIRTQPPARKKPGVEQQVADLVNAHRARRGCPPVRVDPQLRTAAQRHADDMAARNYFEHTGPDGLDPGARISAAGYAWSAWAENIHRGPTTADATVADWMSDAAHRDNILNCRFTHMGIGLTSGPGGPWWTQDFAAH
ncbi:sigma-70 family RNA polymerase sigma factor [Streptomyces spiramyceticus]|uniref:sigma-70 family RNA polymerase sigma factor n=1 Tax=Streptomyces spiramyceticus TaxID=299717 RepID=UPI00237C347A|nr:sigma-70 family RNA polymerase sigma factor [Streptomyces spiramyceticus]